MIDFDQIVEIAKSQGIKQSELADHLGVCAGQIWRYKTGRQQPPVPILKQVARFLGIDLSDVDDSKQRKWISFSRFDLAQLSVFHEQFRSSDSVLTVTNCMDSYLQREEMLEWSNRKYLGIGDWASYCKTFLPYAKEQTRSRSNSKFFHRLVCPWRLFEQAKLEHVDWLAEIRHGLGDFEDVTSVTPIRRWQDVHSGICRLLPPECTGWSKVCVVDSLRVLVTINEQAFVSCSHEPTVHSLRDAIENVVRNFEPAFLRLGQLNRRRLFDSSYDTQSRIENLLMSDEDDNRAHRWRDFFLKMTDSGTIVPANKMHQLIQKVHPR